MPATLKTARPKTRRFLPAAVVAGLCAVFLLAGCSTTSKQKWLTFFFDGVNKPQPALKPATGPAGSGPSLLAQTSRPGATPAAPPAPVGPPPHKPYQDNNCLACHESKFSVQMRAPMKEVCASCHQDLIPVKVKSTHNPVESGDCLSCHNPHYTTNKFLLTRSGKALCADCHDPEIAQPKSIHQPYGDGDCTACHNPHASTNKTLLVRTGKALCFDCHDDFLAKAKFKHDPADNGDCNACHSAHASVNQALLLKDGRKICFDCHEEKDMAAVKAHADTGNASCLSCHDPHAGQDKYLLRTLRAAASGK